MVILILKKHYPQLKELSENLQICPVALYLPFSILVYNLQTLKLWTVIKKEDINGKGYLVVSSGVENQGIIGRTDMSARVLPKNTVTIDMFGNVYYRNFEYKEVTHARVFTLIPNNFTLNTQTGLYIVTSLKWLSKVYSYDNMCSYEKIKNVEIKLPVKESSNTEHQYTVSDIDWDYMQEYIRKLELERIRELELYLRVTGLNSYELTDEEKMIMERNGK